jgi:hypothetical protein
MRSFNSKINNQNQIINNSTTHTITNNANNNLNFECF